MRHLSTLAVLALVTALAGCQSAVPTDGQSQGLYVYTDAQGNLVTMERKATPTPAEPPVSKQAATSNPKAGDRAGQGMESLEDYRPSEEVEQEIEDRENQRFVTYIDETGQLVSRPVDMGAERAAAKAAPAPYEAVSTDGFMETYRPLRADCCLHLLESAQELTPGSENLVEFDADSQQMVGESAYRAVAYKLGDELTGLTLNAFVKKQGYLAAELLWLDQNGTPVMLVDQPFSRKYPETWYRYGYLQGTLEREAGQHYLVVFLPYFEEQPGTDGLLQVTQGELVLLGR